MNENKNNDILDNSYYMIKLFLDNDEEITNLKLQKLMYFVEAYYMVKNLDQSELFSSNWNAWNYGPVNKVLYKHYKKFGSMPISLNDAELEEGRNLPSKNKEYITKVYNIFHNFSAFELVTLTHLDGSPWSKIYAKNQLNQIYDFEQLNDSIINKQDTREWFAKEFNFLFHEVGNGSANK